MSVAMAANKTDKKRIFLSLKQKTDILEHLEVGASVKVLAQEYSVHESTVRRIRSEGTNIRNFADQGSQILQWKNQRKPKHDDLDSSLCKWFLERRTLGDPLSDLLLQEKAMELYNEIGGTSSFTASRGWLTKFKRRHNIRLLHVHGEAGSADEEGAERFLINFAKKVEEGIEGHNIYNMDESGLMWKAIPSKPLVHGGE